MNMHLPLEGFGAESKLVRAPKSSTGVEHELKFIVDRDAYKAAQALPLLGVRASGPAWRRVRSVYYDTASAALKNRGITLRTRKVRGGFLIGVKWAPDAGESAFKRRELEVKTVAAEPNLKALDYRTATELLAITDGQPLAPVFVTDIRRSTRQVQIDGATIEVAFDEGWLIAGAKREALREIELELKSGDPAALYHLGLALVDVLPLTLGVLSKAQRGALLACGAPPAPARAIAPALDAGTIGGGSDRNGLAQLPGAIRRQLGRRRIRRCGDGGPSDARCDASASRRRRFVSPRHARSGVWRFALRGQADCDRDGKGARLGRVSRICAIRAAGPFRRAAGICAS